MLNLLSRSIKYGQLLDMMYMAKDGTVSQRRIKVIQVGESSFRAYCYLRGTNRTFTVDNVLALVPVIKHERDVV